MDHLSAPSLHSDTSSEGSDLPPRHGRSILGPDPVRTATPPSSPVGAEGHKGDDTEVKNAVAEEETRYQKKQEDGESKDAQRITASLTAVLDSLVAIQSKYLKRQPAKNTKVPLSSRDLALLCSLLECEPPFSSHNNFIASERAAVQRLQVTHAKRVKSLGSWFSHCRSDFYDGYLIIRMPSPIHFDVTNDITTYLYHRFHVKLKEAGRPDYTVMLRQGGKALIFKKRRRRHEPDSCIWLDFSRGFAGNDNEEDADRAQAQARAQAQQQDRARTDGEESSEANTQDLGRQERQSRVDAAGGEDAAAVTPDTEPDQVQDEPRDALPKTTKWPAIVIEIGWSHPTPDPVCIDYIKNARGHIRCVIRLNIDYIEPKDEHKFSTPTGAIMDGWRLNEQDPGHEPDHFIRAVDVFAASPSDKVTITLNDLHQSLAATNTVSLSLSKIAGYVRDGFWSQKRGKRNASDSEETSGTDEDSGGEGRHRLKRVRI